MSNSHYELGLTKVFPCSYLPNEEERLLIAVDERLQNNQSYTNLMAEGFRRSSNQSYRPHCPACNKCHSLRILVNQFKPSKSQKRTLKRNQHFIRKSSTTLQDNYYPLYEQYINNCHQDSSMYPANNEQFHSFLSNTLAEQVFIETWHETQCDTHVSKKLICVAIMDILKNGLSAVYTFYHPDYRASGLGVYSILTQIEYCQQLTLPYLYLGYQIDDCQKMNYKNRYFPHEIHIDSQWSIRVKAEKK